MNNGLIVFIISLVSLIRCDLLSSEKSDHIRSMEINELDKLDEILYKNKGNAIVVFHADWCHHCKEFIPKLDEASKYKLTEGFNLIKVNCQNKEICNQFEVRSYPSIKAFYKGKQIEEEPGRDVGSILDFINRLSKPAVINIESNSQKDSFIQNYGDSNFIMYYSEKTLDFYKCVENLAENKYKTQFYVGALKSETEIPRIMFSEKYNLGTEWNSSCEKIQSFMEDNKLPLMKKVDSSYIKRVQKENKTLIMAAISVKNSIQMNIVESYLTDVSVQNRKYVFSYIDVDSDSYLINYFKVDTSYLPQLIVYNFADRTYHIDIEKAYETEESTRHHLNELVRKLDENTINWTTGNILEDLFAKFGIRLNQSGVIYLIAVLFAVLVISFMAVMFCCDKEECNTHPINESNQNKEELQEQTPPDEKKTQ